MKFKTISLQFNISMTSTPNIYIYVFINQKRHDHSPNILEAFHIRKVRHGTNQRNKVADSNKSKTTEMKYGIITVQRLGFGFW